MSPTRFPTRVLLLSSLCLTLATLAKAQTDGAEVTNQNAAGILPFNSYQFGDIDSVNLGAGGVNFRIPLIRVKGRGMDDGLQLVLSTKFRTMNFSRMQVGQQIQDFLAWTTSHDVPTTFQVRSLHGGTVSFDGESYTCSVTAGSWAVKDDSNFTFVDADGAKYLFPNRLVYPLDNPLSTSCPQFSFGDMQTTSTGVSDSGTLQLQASVDSNHVISYSVADKSGKQIVRGWVDTNGNVNSGTLGRTFSTTNNADGSTSITMLDSNGQPQTFKLIYQNLTLGSGQFPTSTIQGISVSNTAVGGTMLLLTQVTLPNGTAYQISYQLPDGTLNPFGEPTKITFPTGGYVRYVYQTFPSFDSYIVNGQGPCGFSALIDSRRVVERDVSPDGVTEQRWQYDYQSSPAYTTTITDPLGNVSVHTFDGNGLHELTTEIRNGTSTVVKRIVNTWEADFGPIQALQAFPITNIRGANCTGPLYTLDSRNYRITNTATTLVDTNQVSQQATTYDSYTYQVDTNDNNSPVTYTDTRMNPIEVDEYDYGNGTVGPLLQKSTYAYLHDSNSNYLDRHIWDRVTLQQVFDGSGNTCKGLSQPCAQTKFVYDSTPLLTAPGVVQHDYTNFPASMTLRGNQTEIQRWRNTDGAWLVTKNTYDELGNLRQVQDPLGNPPTAYDYTDAWGIQAGASSCLPSGGTAQAFITKITDALGHFSTAKYYSCSSLVASKTDQNSQTMTLGYDLFGRPLSTSFPDGGSTSWSFNDSARTASQTTTIGNGVGPLTRQFFYDGLERTTQTALTSDSQGTDYTDTAYDALGHLSQIYNPTRCNPATTNCGESTWGFTTFAHDALGRTTSITSQDGSLTNTSYSGNTTTVSDQAGNQRRSTNDSLGRLIEVDEPGAASPGAQATGSLTISGILNSTMVGGTAAKSGSGSFTIAGTEGQIPGPCDPTLPGCSRCNSRSCSVPIFNHGTDFVTVNGVQFAALYGQGSTALSVATVLASALSGSSNPQLNASASSVDSTHALMTVTAKAVGSATNYPLAVPAATFDSTHFPSASFFATASGASLTGGVDASPVFDSGTLSVSVNGFTVSGIPYGQSSNANASQVAQAVATALKGSGSPVTVNNVSGATISLVYNSVGTVGNVGVTVSPSSSNPSSFPNGSFSSSVTLAGGVNPVTLGNATQYAYDALNNLVRADQKGGTTDSTKWRTRTFTYNSLSQLITVTNPESGTITYTYDANSNLLTKKDARGITTTYGYDALNRLTGKTYSNSDPSVVYRYDQSPCLGASACFNIGRRTSMTDAAGSEAWSYDKMGRPLADQRVTSGITKSTSYTYNLDGSVHTLTYPTGRTITYKPDSAGRAVSAVDTANSINYATGAAYTPAGALSALTNGAAVSTLYFNTRLQPCRISVKSTGTTPSSCSDTANIGNLLDMSYNFSLGSADNGNVTSITNNRDNTRSQSFAYDALNRLASAQTQTSGVTIPNSNCWGLTFGYDAWGNLLSSTSSGPSGCGEPLPLSVSATPSNRISGFCYDASGNLLDQGACPTSGPHVYTYNAENQLVSTAGFTYTYDGDGNRVEKNSGTLYWYGMGSDTLDETDLTGATTNTAFKEYVFFNGKRIARRDSSNNVDYYFADHLGTARVVASAAGAILDDSDFYPFGGERAITTSSGNNYKFTGKERDSESGLDDFDARYYSSSMGRFMSPDWSAAPMGVPYADFGNPQSLNLYSYVKNNPTTFEDADGHCCEDELKFLGQELIGVGKGVVNFAPSVYNTAATILNVQFVENNLQTLPLAPTLPLNSLGQVVGSDVATLGIAATGLVEGGAGADAAGAARTGESVGSTVPKEGIYEGPDATAPGKTYVGQSGNIPERLVQHGESGTGKFPEGTKVSTTDVKGGKTAREVAEQKRIDQLGGVKSKPGSQTSNVRNPIGPKRKDLVDKP